MITITTTTKELARRAKEVMEHELLYNVNLNGAEYEVEIGDFNEINGVEAYIGNSLYSMIFLSRESDDK